MSMQMISPMPAMTAGRHVPVRRPWPAAARGAGAAPFTLVERLAAEALRAACLGSGMHVLDVGRGASALPLLIAAIVGPSGRVVAVDRSTEAIVVAEPRAAAAAERTNLRFVRAAPSALDFDTTFDVLIVRSLLSEADPVDLLRRLVRHLEPGGVLVVQELATDGDRLRPSLFDRVYLNSDCTEAEMQIAIRLSRCFRSLGLRPPSVSVGADLDALTLRLRLEATRFDRAAELPPLVTAWARV